MERLRVAIIGASGIGKFHFREFMNAGAKVTAILGSSPETARKTAQSLGEQFGVTPNAYSDLDNLIKNEKLDAVSICTPAEMHYAQTKKCLESGLHVLCEKPFVLDPLSGNYKLAKQLIELAEKNDQIISVNTQWPAVLRYIRNVTDLSEVKDFSMYMEPGAQGKEMLTEILPHANSLLVKLIPEGYARDIKFWKRCEDETQVSFLYSNKNSECNVGYHFKFKADRPRRVNFSINDQQFEREIGDNYQQMFVSNGKKYLIEDPFKISIGKFVDAIKGRDCPLISTEEILENVRLQEDIVAVYQK